MTNLFRLALRMVVLAAIIAALATPARADTPVTLKGQVELRGMTVKLSDIFDGVPTDIDRDIAQAPAPGKQVTYDSTVLTRIAQKYRLGWEAKNLADHILITTASTRITPDVIREAVIKKFKESGVALLHKDSEIDISFDNHALQIDLPADHDANFTLSNFDVDPSTHHFHTDLVAETSSGPFSVPVTGRVIVKRNVPVLAHRLEGGTTIGGADLDWVMLPEDRINGEVMTEASQLIGRELRRDTDGGEVLHAHDVMPARLVTRGSIVTMRIDTSLMIVTAQAKALQDGAQGDVVRVVNTQSNRMIEGTVTGPGTVTITTAIQKVATAQ